MIKKYILLVSVILMLGIGTFFAVYFGTASQPGEVRQKSLNDSLLEKATHPTKQANPTANEPNPNTDPNQNPTQDSNQEQNQNTNDAQTPAQQDQDLITQIRKQQKILQHNAYLASLSTIAGKQVASFHTSLDGDNASGRVQNIILACKIINNTVLLPSDEFSFNTKTGNSNLPANGWKQAIEIVNNKFVEGYGGGICQVSTTIYNAVLQAGLQIDERHTHSLSVPYIAHGHDATVDYPLLDLKFTNTHDAPVRLQTLVTGNDVICRVYVLPKEQ